MCKWLLSVWKLKNEFWSKDEDLVHVSRYLEFGEWCFCGSLASEEKKRIINEKKFEQYFPEEEDKRMHVSILNYGEC